MPSIPNTNYAAGGTLDHGQTVYISCDEGYSYQQETVFEVTCFYDGLRYKTVTPTQCYSKYFTMVVTVPLNRFLKYHML